MLKDKQYGERKGYLDSKGSLTKYGEDLYLSLFEENDVKIKKRENKDDQFEEWWKVYPSSDFFEYRGRTFKGVQKKNIRKEECRRIFNVMVNGGKWTAEQVIEATRKHIEMTKELSYKKGANQMTFIPNSERYLNEKRFEIYIGKEEKVSDMGPIDI